MVRIEDVRRERKTIWITLENSEKIKLPLSIYRECPLQSGDSVDPEEYDQWIMVRQYRFALDRAVSYLAARACSRTQIQQKLLRVGYRPCTVQMVLIKLDKEHLLNDDDFARQWVQSRVNRRMGPMRISRELRQKGISAEGIEDALSDVDEEELICAAAALAAKQLSHAKAGQDPRKTVQRISAMLSRRGYPWSITGEAVRRALDDAGESFPDDN